MSRADQPQQPKGGWENPHIESEDPVGGYGVPKKILDTFLREGEAVWITDSDYFDEQEGDITEIGDEALIANDAENGGVDFDMYPARINLITKEPSADDPKRDIIQVHFVRVQKPTG